MSMQSIQERRINLDLDDLSNDTLRAIRDDLLRYQHLKRYQRTWSRVTAELHDRKDHKQ